MTTTTSWRRRGCLYATAAGLEGPFEAEARDPDVLDAAEEDRLLAGAPWRRYVTLGDSIAEGMAEEVDGYAPVHWSGRLADALRRRQPELDYLNLGRRDLRAAEIREQQLGPALEWRPDLAVIIGGGNDLLAEVFDPQAVVFELENIAVTVKQTGATVITSTMFDITKALEMPPEFGNELETRLHSLFDEIRAMSARHGTVLIDFALEPFCADAGIYATDFKHANARGHALAASTAIRRLGALLGNAPTPRSEVYAPTKS